jgi:radical SAM superfamily enzyme YgiQ (UPF0313 family)
VTARWSLVEKAQKRLGREQGTVHRSAGFRVALAYPSPYHVAMSSLGFQAIYRLINQLPDVAAERTFLPDDEDRAAHTTGRVPLFTLESQDPVSGFDVLAASVAYELEVAGLIEVLELAGLEVLAKDRTDGHPPVICGGPLTFSNPLPLGPFADAVVLGEGEDLIGPVLERLRRGGPRQAWLDELASLPGVWVPSRHGDRLGPIAKAGDERLPACSQVLTPDTELSDMFLVEPERGCSRGCTYCVMRRTTNGGMRLVDPQTVLGLIPEEARKVGLVGAAVTDHPRLPEILRGIVEGGRQVGISSLRAERLTAEIVGLLAQGGYRAITFASDGASQRMRDVLQRKNKTRHFFEAATLAKEAGMKGVKVYQMVGVPGETDEDIDELVQTTLGLSQIIPVALGVAPFVAKRNTPLDGSPFAPVPVLEARLDRLRRGLRGRAEVRPTSVRWAYVEYLLAQGTSQAGLAALEAHRAGGGFAAWKKAFESRGADVRRAEPVVPSLS